jgi:hypothetical protein
MGKKDPLPDLFSISGQNRGPIGERVLPEDFGRPKGNGDRGEAAPMLPPLRGRMSSPLPSRSPIAPDRGDDTAKLERELSELVDVIYDVAAEKQELAAELRPSDNRRDELMGEIAATHHGARYLRATAGERGPMFEELMAMASEWGSRRQARANLSARLKRLERQRDRVMRELKKAKEPKRAKRSAQHG